MANYIHMIMVRSQMLSVPFCSLPIPGRPKWVVCGTFVHRNRPKILSRHPSASIQEFAAKTSRTRGHHEQTRGAPRTNEIEVCHVACYATLLITAVEATGHSSACVHAHPFPRKGGECGGLVAKRISCCLKHCARQTECPPL